jgi:hypothetical protein
MHAYKFIIGQNQLKLGDLPVYGLAILSKARPWS